MMNMRVLPSLLLLSLITVSTQQPPGVPPRQPPHGQPQHQQQHDQPHQQQHQQQHDQAHQQQNNQPHQQQHDQAHQEGHGHGHHGKPLEFASEAHNADHILEHLQKVVATKSKDEMSQEELEFHYFKLHDYDNNNQLDGSEIVQAVTHVHQEQNTTGNNDQQLGPVLSDEDLAKTVDGILETFDQDKNGYVEYFEFKRMSQASAAGAAQATV